MYSTRRIQGERESQRKQDVLLMSKHSVLMAPQGRMCHNVFSIGVEAKVKV